MSNATTKSISEFNGISNNLNFIKFIAALLVVYRHSFPVTAQGTDFLSAVTDGAISIGGFAVAIFLFSSGYFVTKSLVKKGDKGYFLSRFAKIYPAFFAVTVITVFVIGPVVSTLPPAKYFSNAETYKYFSFLFFVPYYSLPGVFKGNVVTEVNGPLWTLTLEVICYILLFAANKLKLLNKKAFCIISALLFAAAIPIFILKLQPLASFSDYIRPLYMFFAGALCYVFSDKIKIKHYLVVLAILCLGLGVFSGYTNFAVIICLPYLLCAVIFSDIQVPKSLAKCGEISYSMYLVGFIIQQIYMNYFPDLTEIQNFLISAVTDIIIAIPLYLFVEKPCSSYILKKN